jgi:hypothetical protein
MITKQPGHKKIRPILLSVSFKEWHKKSIRNFYPDALLKNRDLSDPMLLPEQKQKICLPCLS